MNNKSADKIIVIEEARKKVNDRPYTAQQIKKVKQPPPAAEITISPI